MRWANKVTIPGSLLVHSAVEQPVHLLEIVEHVISLSKCWTQPWHWQEDKPGLPTVPQTVNSRIIRWLSSLSSFNHNWARPSKGTGMRLIPTEPINFFYRISPCLTSGISAAVHCFGSIAFMLLAVLCADYPSSQSAALDSTSSFEAQMFLHQAQGTCAGPCPRTNITFYYTVSLLVAFLKATALSCWGPALPDLPYRHNFQLEILYLHVINISVASCNIRWETLQNIYSFTLKTENLQCIGF